MIKGAIATPSPHSYFYSCWYSAKQSWRLWNQNYDVTPYNTKTIGAEASPHYGLCEYVLLQLVLLLVCVISRKTYIVIFYVSLPIKVK